MSSQKDIEKRLHELGRAIGVDDSFGSAVMARIRATVPRPSLRNRNSSIQKMLGRFAMNRSIKWTAAAAVVAAMALAVGFWGQLGSSAYAIEQTIQALHNVRYMHIVKRDKAGNLEDERWEEIGPDGFQARYRQNTPSHSFYVIDDRQTVMVYHASEDKNTVVLQSPEDSYTWHYAPGKMFDEIAEGKPAYAIVAENVRYKGRPAHHLREVAGDTDVYIDPQTKLPMAVGDYEISYEEPPEGTFDVVIPEGAIVVDRRPGAEPGPEPQWMVQERQEKEQGEIAQSFFEQGRRALAAGQYAAAVDALTKSLEIAPIRNWAQFWLGRALCESSRYDEAIYQLARVIDMLNEHNVSIPSYHLARALAYQGKGMIDMAQIDFEKALPKMIESLRNSKAGWSFDLADDPLRRADGMRDEDCHDAPTPEQSLIMMINRLRLFTGQNFGYDPNASEQEREQAIIAWEQWFRDSGRMQFTPDAALLPVPPADGSGSL